MIKKICLMTRGGKEVVGRRVVVTSEFEANRENIWCKIQEEKFASQKPVLYLMIILLLLGKKGNLFALKCSYMDLFQ